MATNGSFDTTPYSNRYLTFAWSVYKTSIEDNYTEIYWELKGAGTQTQYLKTGPITLVIDGETVYDSPTRIQLLNGTLVASGFKTIYHNSDGSRNFSASVSAAIYLSTVNCTGSGNWDLDRIPRAAKITEAPDFDDTWATYTVGIDNPAGSALIVRACISWTGGDDISYRELSWYEKEHGYYTFTFTSEEMDKLRAATTNGSTSRDVTVYITTFSSGWNVIGYSTKQVKFTVTDCKPELNPTVIDKGNGSTALTDNPETMIRGFNCLYASFNASAPKGGSIVSKTVTCGGKTLYGDGYFGDGLTYHVYDNNFIFTVTDNRGQTKSATVTMPAIDYVPVSCNVSYEAELDPENNTANIIVTLSGNYFNGSFGAVPNELTLQVKCSEGSLNVDSWEDIIPTVSNGTYTATKRIENINYKDTYVVQAYVSDKINLNGSYTKEQIIKIVPVFDWGENDFNFNVPVTIEGKSIVDMIYPIGSIYMSVNYFDPGTIFGGTWERLMDRFLLGSGSIYANGSTGGEATHTLTVSEMPSHQHRVGYANNGALVTLNKGTDTGNYLLPWTANSGYSAADLVGLETGGSQAHNNMPPYLVVNMWKRTA